MILSIKERIERVVRRAFAGVAGIGTVYRWDKRGVRDPQTGLGVDAAGERLRLQSGDALLFANPETAAEAGSGGGDLTEKTLPLEIHLKVLAAESDTTGTASSTNAWLLALETAIMADPHLTEPTGLGLGQALALDTRVTATHTVVVVVDGQEEVDVGLAFEVTYTHQRNDPSVGPGIAALTPPPAPTHFAVSGTDFTWDDMGVDTYTLWRSADGGAWAILTANIGSAHTTDGSAAAGHSYRYLLASVAGGVSGDFSALLTVNL